MTPGWYDCWYHDMTPGWYDCWYDMIWYDMIWYDPRLWQHTKLYKGKTLDLPPLPNHMSVLTPLQPRFEWKLNLFVCCQAKYLFPRHWTKVWTKIRVSCASPGPGCMVLTSSSGRRRGSRSRGESKSFPMADDQRRRGPKNGSPSGHWHCTNKYHKVLKGYQKVPKRPKYGSVSGQPECHLNSFADGAFPVLDHDGGGDGGEGARHRAGRLQESSWESSLPTGETQVGRKVCRNQGVTNIRIFKYIPIQIFVCIIFV